MLSATPVNNRFTDLRNQLALAYEGCSENLSEKLNTKKTIEEIFRQAQRVFNEWSDYPKEQRTTDSLLRMLDFDFFELLDSVTIARSRKHIQKYYNSEKIGKFPERLKPISLTPCLTDLSNAINYNEIYSSLIELSLCIYMPSHYIFESKLSKYMDTSDNFRQSNRELGIRRLMAINLLKRLESSVNSFSLTLQRILDLITTTINAINTFEKHGAADLDMYEMTDDDLDIDDSNTDFTVGKKVKIDLADMDYRSWRDDLQKDKDTLELLILMIRDITPEHDSKLQALFELIAKKQKEPINAGNKKIIIFTAFSDMRMSAYMSSNNSDLKPLLLRAVLTARQLLS